MRDKKVAVVGVGLIGGSVGMALKKRHLVDEVIGIVRRQESIDESLKLGAVDRATLDLEEEVKDVNLSLIATPVGIIPQTAERIARRLSPGAIITDVGSTKAQVVKEVEDILPDGISFVGAHPMAGSERGGVNAARADLFEGSVCVLTPGDKTTPGALKTVKSLWESMGARTVEMKPEEHDFLVAATSHLPHLVATALVNLVDNLKGEDERILSLIASGFKDTTRIASSSPLLWQDICLTNKKNIATMIDRLMALLEKMKECILEEDMETLLREFEKAKSLRDQL